MKWVECNSGTKNETLINLGEIRSITKKDKCKVYYKNTTVYEEITPQDYIRIKKYLSSTISDEQEMLLI